MPQKKTLYQQLCNLSTLRAAWNGLNRTNKESKGLSEVTIRDFEKKLEKNLKQLQASLKNNTFKFFPLRAATLAKPGTSKLRGIKIPEIKDRIVLKAISTLISKYLETSYPIKNEASFAYQKKIGTRNAIERMQHLYSTGKHIAYKGDIENFFDSVNTEILLLQYVFPVLPDPTLNNLITTGISIEIGNRSKLTDAQWDVFENTGSGIPQGSSLSPLLSNVYLVEFDQTMLDQGYGLIRYADDFIVMCSTKEEANNAYRTSKEILEKKLLLKLHPINTAPDSKSKIVRITQDNFEFLSIGFNGQRIWPSKNKRNELLKKISIICDQPTNVIELLVNIKNVLHGWLAAFYYTDLDPYLEEFDENINRKLFKALFAREWKFESKDGKRSISPNQRFHSGIRSSKQIVQNLRELSANKKSVSTPAFNLTT